MQRNTLFLGACLAMGVACNAAPAQNSPATPRVGAEIDAQKPGQDQTYARNRAPQAGYLAHANQVLDMTLRDPQGKEIGAVEDMVIDSQGRVAFVIVSFDDAFVTGGKLYAVPPQSLHPGSDPARKDLILTTTKDKFTAATGFTKDRYPQFDEQSTRDTYRRFDQTPYWEDRTESRDRDYNHDQPGRSGPRSQFEQPKLDRDTEVRDNLDSPTSAQQVAQDARRDRVDGFIGQKSDKDRRHEFSQTPRFDGQHTWTCRVSEVIGKNVVDTRNESLGSVTDLLVDARQNRVVYAVLSDGGVLSIGETLTPIPYSALKAVGDKEHFTLDATKKSFEAFSFTEGAWPDLANRQWAQRVHAQFKQDPYWAGYGAADTDSADEHWRGDSAYNKGFSAGRSTTIAGTVTSIGEFSPETGAAKGRQIMLRSEDGNIHTVHLGPSSFMQRQDPTFAIKQGDEVTITGSTCRFQDKDVLIASKILNKDGKALELRDNNGRPKWDNEDADNRPDNRNQDDAGTISDRRTDRSDLDSRILSSPKQSTP